MKTRVVFPALIILLLIPVISFTQSSVTIRLGPDTGEDCFLSSYIPNTPLPNETEMVAASWTYNGSFNLWRPLFRFNLNEFPPGYEIDQALLSLYGNPAPNSALHFGANESYIRKVTSQWDQNSVTWETQPDFSTVNQVLLHESTSPTQDYPDIDITDMVREMVIHPETNYGFIIMNRIEYFYRCLNFASSECFDVNKRPKLVIMFHPESVGIDPVSNDIPVKYNLYQNFPNPFNPVTNIKFDIPKSSFASLKIFDELGREVSSLVNERLDAGSYKVQWDGSKFSSGMYFMKLESEDVFFTKKIILIK